jgi:hypothetical protein
MRLCPIVLGELTSPSHFRCPRHAKRYASHPTGRILFKSQPFCVIDTDGKIKAEAKLPSEVEDILAYLERLELEIAAVGFDCATEGRRTQTGSAIVACPYGDQSFTNAGFRLLINRSSRGLASLT